MNKQSGGFLIVSTAALLAACGSQEEGGASGTYTLHLTDAPTHEFSKVEITVTKVVIKPEDSQAIEFVLDEPITQDLLQLQGGGSIPILEDVEIAPGRYEWVRLFLDMDSSFAYTSDGGQKTLHVPSASNTGLKLVRGFTIEEGQEHQFTVDFDVNKSIVEPKGADADYFLKPVLRLVNNQQVGVISGRVDASSIIQEQCSNPSVFTGMVYVFEGEDVVPDDLGSDAEPLVASPVNYDSVSEEYRYKVAFLEEGQYTVSYTCSSDDNELDEDLTFYGITDVSVISGGNSKVNFD